MKKRLLAALLAIGSFAQAEIYQLKINAEVSNIEGDLWDSSVALGSAMTAVYNFDTGVVPFTPDATLAFYFPLGASTTTVGNYTGTSPTSVLVTHDNSVFGDGYQFDAGDGITGLPTSFFNFAGGRLWSSNLSLLSNTNQPVQEFPISSFDSQGLFIGGFTDESGTAESRQEIDGRIISYEVLGARVPDNFPTFAGVGFACVLLAYVRGRDSRKNKTPAL
jgi:hypothetical protein